MRLFSYFGAENKEFWKEKIRSFDWGAAKFLADILEQNRFDELLYGGDLFILADGDELVSFCTLTRQDCIEDKSLCPWIGFVYTADAYRGHRYSGRVIDFACSYAARMGFDRVYLATDHIGLYEKYGFTYLENRKDVYGDDSRIYYR
ncbi:MAG: GNAT family N-acetyltransferase [Clostridia bacterium]|nr:GNAT family N-acetyltransferase [Clostridia bacterium]